MHVDITPEQRIKIAERYKKQLAGMLEELEGWYPDKRLTSEQLSREHGSFKDRLGSLANDLGYMSFCELLRFEGFDIELDKNAARNPTKGRIVIDESLDAIAERGLMKLDSYIEKIDEWYPDGDVSAFAKEHKKTKENLSKVAQNLGFESWAELLKQLGYIVPEGFSPRSYSLGIDIDLEEIFSDLVCRYEGKERPGSLKALIADNPDLEDKLRHASNNATKLFGRSLSQELKSRGLIGAQTLEDRVSRAVRQLWEYYPDGKVFELKKLHNSLAKRVGQLWREAGYENVDAFYSAHGLQKLAGSNGGGPSTFDPESLIAELMARYEGKERPGSLKALIADNPDLEDKLRHASNNATKLFGRSLSQELKSRGLIGAQTLEDRVSRAVKQLWEYYPDGKVFNLRSSHNSLARRVAQLWREEGYENVDAFYSAHGLQNHNTYDASISDGAILAMLDDLALKYASISPKPSNIPELKAGNLEFEKVFRAFERRCRSLFDATPGEKLVELGILEDTGVYGTQMLEDRVSRAVKQLWEYYPDGKVFRLSKEHSSLSDRITQLWREAGYESIQDFYKAYGFEPAVSSKGGRRKSVDPEAVLAELESRYDGIDPAPDYATLAYENPDFSKNFKTLGNVSKDVFGDTWSNVLKAHGILAGDMKEKLGDMTLERAEQLIAYLQADIEKRGSTFATLAEIDGVLEGKMQAEFSHLSNNCKALYGKALGVLLRERGVIAERTSAAQKAQLTDEEIEGILAEIKQSYTHAVRPKNLKCLEAEQPLYAQNTAPIKRYLKARGYGSTVKYFEEQECLSRFWREDSLPRPQDDEIEKDQALLRMTPEELLKLVPNAELTEFDTTVSGSEEYGQAPYYEMLRVGDYLDTWVDEGIWVHLSFCGHDLGLVGWQERYEYCLVDYVNKAEECGVVNGRVYAQITGFAGGPITPRAQVHMFFAVDPAKRQFKPKKGSSDYGGYMYDSRGWEAYDSRRYGDDMAIPALEDVYDDVSEYAFSYNEGSPEGFSYSFWMPVSGDGDDGSISSSYLRFM